VLVEKTFKTSPDTLSLSLEKSNGNGTVYNDLKAFFGVGSVNGFYTAVIGSDVDEEFMKMCSEFSFV